MSSLRTAIIAFRNCLHNNKSHLFLHQLVCLHVMLSERGLVAANEIYRNNEIRKFDLRVSSQYICTVTYG
jgi:hypothetical protein